MKQHFVYRITNLLNGREYVGKHSTTNLDDGYMGSSIILRAAIQKYGIENFKREVISYFESEDEALQFEQQIVNEEFISNPKTYNINCGGKGKFPWHDLEFRQKQSIISSERMKKNHELGKVRPVSWTGKKHKQETIEKMKLSQKGLRQGEKNGSFGTKWIWHPAFGNKKCKKDTLEKYLNEGWILGRKLNK